MTKHRFDRNIVREVLRELAPVFYTKDLSSHRRMLVAHPELVNQSHYHSLAGRYLSTECDDVERAGGKDRKLGERWRNLLANTAGTGAPASSTGPAAIRDDRPASGELGPQYTGDDAFTARVRRHMSWYRASVLRVPCGTGPTEASTKLYGNMLTRVDAERGLNFLTPEIHEVALARLREGGGVVERYRLLHNMLSSQPMCFNLFGPLVHDRALATALLQTIPELQVARVRDVKIEYAPGPRSEYLGDSTAFDAFIDYVRLDGSFAFLGIETKLTDRFSAKHYDSPLYRRWMRGKRSPFRAEADTQVALEVHNQLWRDHLLALAMRDHASAPYQHGALVLVRHHEDRACGSIVEAYQQLLVPGDTTFIDLPIDRLLDRWQSAALTPPQAAWLQAFRRRYLSLHESESALIAHGTSK